MVVVCLCSNRLKSSLITRTYCVELSVVMVAVFPVAEEPGAALNDLFGLSSTCAAVGVVSIDR